MKYKNGYSDGSGKGTIVKIDEDGKERAILRTHWGCSCCDYFDENDEECIKKIKLADKVVNILNKNKELCE